MAAHARTELSDGAPHVLVVDDDRRLRELLARYLAEQGFRVTAAASARSTSADTRTTISFAITAAPRRGWTSIVVATCRDAPFVRGSLAYSLTTTLAASTTIPVVPM